MHGAQGGEKAAYKMAEAGSDTKRRVRALGNTLKPRNFQNRSDRWFAVDSYTEPHGAMFGVGEDDPQGFLALTKSDEEGTAVIRQLRVEGKEPEVIRILLEKALTYLKDKGISDVSISVSEAYRETEHVLEEFGFEIEASEGEMRLFRAHL